MTSAEALRRVGASVQGEISDVLVALQFQDRVSQILHQAVDDMERLASFLETGRLARAQAGATDVIDATAWLDELCRTYTTAEQLENHQGVQAQAREASDITFF